MPPKYNILRDRRITAPIAAFTMAVLLYTYSVSSIRAAKLNAQRHREADGGQLNMRNEMYRQRGWIDRPSSDRELMLAGLKGEKTEKRKGQGEAGKGAAGGETNKGTVAALAEKEKREGEEKLAEARGKLRRGESIE